MRSDLPPETHRQLRTWRIRIFITTWLSYCGMYFCRKPFYIVKPALTEELGIGADRLASIGTAYLTAYTVGQFASGAVGSWIGARQLVLAGMVASIGCNVLFGLVPSYPVLFSFMIANGLAQATGWSGNVGTMAQWTSREERGTVMGLWSTCYLLGGIFANGAATLLQWWLGWRWAFFGGGMILGGITLVFFLWQRDRPEDVGLPPFESARPEAHETSGLGRLGWDRGILTTLCLVGGFYFCVKYIRYALWSWAPYFLRHNFGLAHYAAGLLATLFDCAGLFGVLAAGVLSDRYYHGRRAAVAQYMLVGMTLSCLLLCYAGTTSVIAFSIGLALVGFMLYGPDSLLSAAGAIDLGGRRGSFVTAGVINGMGSLGSIIQEQVVGELYTRGSGELGPILTILLGASAFALICMTTVLWRNRRGQSDF